jgi:hypothetical protein
MKKSFLLLMLLVSVVISSAQSSKYEDAMLRQIARIDTAYVVGNFAELGANFERIATAEKKEWLPYYYAAFCYVMDAIAQTDKSRIDAIANKADELLNKSVDILKNDNSETFVVRSMIASAHMSVDPSSRYVQYGKDASQNIVRAKEADASNPRPVYLEAIEKYLTPPEFGGSRDAAKTLFEKVLKMNDAFKAKSKLYPTWCRMGANYYLAQYAAAK